jgi:O-methyltransferase
VVSADRQYVIERLLRQAIGTVAGDVAECGVYRGGTARLMADVIKRNDAVRKLLLFDTFAGMPETNPKYDLHLEGDFADTSLDAVREFLSDYANCRLFPGFIPDTFAEIENQGFCFVHIDLDIYSAITAASEFFYPRVPQGGFLIYDDYGFPTCPGARRAVDMFFADKPEKPLVLQTGQCLVFRGPSL